MTEDKKPLGRSTRPENQARIEYILKRVNEAPGISSPDLAKEMEIPSMATSHFGDRLVRQGLIKMVKKVPTGTRTYYPAD